MRAGLAVWFPNREIQVAYLTYVDGSVLDSDRRVIAHGVNCRGKFASGVAGQIAKRFPEVKRSYLRKFESEDSWSLGDIQLIQTNSYNNKIIANLATQDRFGHSGKYVDYSACELAFDRLGKICASQGFGCAMPKIGTGLGGGEWGPVEEALQKAINKWGFDVDVHTIG